MKFLEVSNIEKNEGGRSVLNNISFSLTRRKKIAFMGETGSGKSSLMKIIAGYLKADKGYVLFKGKRVLSPDEVLIPGHKEIAYLSQHFELRNNYRVIELLEMASQLNNKEAEEIFKICNVQQLLQRKTNELSGGERQRIALSRLLLTKPQLLILDEPYTNLDRLHKSIISKVIHEISNRLDITCILVSHDPIDVLSWADEVIILKKGNIIQQGAPNNVYYSPIDEYSAGIMGDYNLLKKESITTVKKWGITEYALPLFIRPEQLEVASNAEKAVEATVEKVFFCGGHSTIYADAGGLLLTIQAQEPTPTRGDKIFIKFNAKEFKSTLSAE